MVGQGAYHIHPNFMVLSNKWQQARVPVCVSSAPHTMHLDTGVLIFCLQAKPPYLPSIKELLAPRFLSENTRFWLSQPRGPEGPQLSAPFTTASFLLSQHKNPQAIISYHHTEECKRHALYATTNHIILTMHLLWLCKPAYNAHNVQSICKRKEWNQSEER